MPEKFPKEEGKDKKEMKNVDRTEKSEKKGSNGGRWCVQGKNERR